MLDSVGMRVRTLPLLAAAAVFFAPPARADNAQVPDRAKFEIRVHDKIVGAETMTISDDGDSISVVSNTVQLLGPTGSDSLIKDAAIGADSYDLNLRSYASIQRYKGHRVQHSFALHDTMFTSFRDVDGRGYGDTFARPPGHLFVVDPGVFSSFELICRMLRGHAFVNRTVNLVVLGAARDTVLASPLVDDGEEPFRWETKAVQARKFTLGAEPAAYHIWMTSEGHLLRLEHHASGLRVDRQAAPVKRKRPDAS